MMSQELHTPNWQPLEIHGGRVIYGPPHRLLLPPIKEGYANTQLDDYGRTNRRADFPWWPGLSLQLTARFSHEATGLQGTAGFGFWNAPFGDPTIGGLALPQATWFFFASPPSDLPFAEQGPGRGWFAGTVDAATPRALVLAPLSPLALLAHQFGPLRRIFWPAIRRHLAITYAPLTASLTEWHGYELVWARDGCRFLVDGRLVHETPHSPHGPLGFVCWIDNQYLVLTPRGRLSWGTLTTSATQWLEIDGLSITPALT